MSVVPSSVIKTYAESIGLTNLGDDILTALAQDVEYRTRELIQDAMKHMHNSKRTRLSVADINNTLEQRCVEVSIYFHPVHHISVLYFKYFNFQVHLKSSAPHV